MTVGTLEHFLRRFAVRVGKAFAPTATWVARLDRANAVRSACVGPRVGRVVASETLASTSLRADNGARAGARHLQQLLNRLDPPRRKLILGDRAGDLVRVATGVSAWATVRFSTLEAAELARAAIAPSQTLEMGSAFRESDSVFAVGLVNKAAFQDVVRKYPAAFPAPASVNLTLWIIAIGLLRLGAMEREKHALHLGLLSGFPLRAVEGYSVWLKARSILSKPDAAKFEKPGPYSPLEGQRFARLLAEAGQLTPSELERVLAGRLLPIETSLHFRSFDPEDVSDLAEATARLREGLLELDDETRRMACTQAPSLAAALQGGASRH